MLGRAGFAGPQRLVVPGGQALARTRDDVAAGMFSMSSSAPHLFGARRDEFEADLYRLLREASPSGLFSERRPSTEVFVWWNPPHSAPYEPLAQPNPRCRGIGGEEIGRAP